MRAQDVRSSKRRRARAEVSPYRSFRTTRPNELFPVLCHVEGRVVDGYDDLISCAEYFVQRGGRSVYKDAGAPVSDLAMQSVCKIESCAPLFQTPRFAAARHHPYPSLAIQRQMAKKSLPDS